MCGIFGIISDKRSNFEDIHQLATHAEQRGKDSSGLLYYQGENYCVEKSDNTITELLRGISIESATEVVLGHSRLITNGLSDNQPVIRDGLAVLHNGIIVNADELWGDTLKKRQYKVDSEIIAALAADHIEQEMPLDNLPSFILKKCKGIVSCAVVAPSLGKLILFSNNGSLYIGKRPGSVLFSSEKYPLQKVKSAEIKQIRNDYIIIDIPKTEHKFTLRENNSRTKNLIPELVYKSKEEELLQYPIPNFRRCSKCILPDTMPFIEFDDKGVCNYCSNYKIRNNPKPKEDLMELLEGYRRKEGNDCIVPFSGGRDSCYALHLIVNELKMKPVTYTYDWGMVTDLGRRNISRMCAELNVENIIVAADIEKKRQNIRKNIKAWLRSPHLGMISIFTAGDKHFFKYVETVKKQTGIRLDLWGANPLEVTHFKAGFLGVPPDFATTKVYNNGLRKQVDYHSKRLRAMIQSPGYFNSSLWDTLSGEYHRSVMPKSDYVELFDYWSWDERRVDQTLAMYDWEKATDTSTTWRIGDGTAAFYNYIYRTVAGFSEHDTFRSNQIREGQITREEALALIEHENRPRYTNIKWYLDSVNLDFSETIEVINTIPRLYSEV